MFTGIIEGLGQVVSIQKAAQGARLTIAAPFDMAEVKLGASIAVNGACLTAAQISGQTFAADVSYETLRSTGLGGLASNDKVNLERALKAADRLDGHIVSGHVDGTGVIIKRENIGAPKELLDQMVLKGSVAVDGVSLTINALNDDAFTVSIIPHTRDLTTVGFKPVQSRVNLETDILGKYVQRFLGLTADAPVKQSLTLENLIANGFV